MVKNKESRIPTSFSQDFDEFVKEFAGESDRAVVILGATKLDLLLYQLLIKVVLPNVGGNDELFEGDAPLSTFNARINLSFRLGLIDASLARALHLVRKIRNSFAHEITGRSLDSGAHRDRIRELVVPLEKTDVFHNMKQNYFKDKSDVAADFRSALVMIIARLHRAIDVAIPITPSRPVPLIAPSWQKPKQEKVYAKE
jgi:hypothetical protein